MKSPAFQLYAADFYMDTVSWSATEVGAYFRLLMHEWVNGPLPDNNAQLARIAGVDHKTMGKFWMQSVGKKFVQNAEGTWENSRLEKTREDQRKYVESLSEAGKIGAEKRWKKDSDPISDPNSESMRLQSSSSNKEYIVEIIDYLNQKTGKKFSAKTKATVNHIKARIKEGHTLEDFKRVIDIKAAKWGTNPKMMDYLRPETLFGTKFESYLNESVKPNSDGFNPRWNKQ
jgi:uncharacterized phage protein (TIGR02220 family)